MGRREQDGGVGLHDEVSALLEEGLPVGIPAGRAPGARPRVEVGIGPEMADFVRLPGLGHPGADVAGMPLAGRHHVGEVAGPLPHPAHLRAVVAQLVHVALSFRRLEGQKGVHQANVLAHELGAEDGQVVLRPGPVLRERRAQAPALVQALVAPQVHDLAERTDLGGPVALELAVVVAANRAADLGGVLHHRANLAGGGSVGAKLVDHEGAPLVWG